MNRRGFFGVIAACVAAPFVKKEKESIYKEDQFNYFCDGKRVYYRSVTPELDSGNPNLFIDHSLYGSRSSYGEGILSQIDGNTAGFKELSNLFT